jgi:alpha-tubulin suppressor-like RCC1 family protein
MTGMVRVTRVATVVAAVSLVLAAVPSVAVGAANSQLYAFGVNDCGQLGNTINLPEKPDSPKKPNPNPALVSLPGATGAAVQAAAGPFHSLAVTSTGQLYAFGCGARGELGNAGTFSPTPVRVTLPGATGSVIQVAAGWQFSLAVTSTGQLYAFGLNDYGQLGSATNSGTDNPNPTPARVSLPGATGPVTQAAGGDRFSLALTSTGQMYAFGGNYYGELGKATNSGTLNPNPTPAQVTLPGATGPVARIAAGGAHSLAVTSTGQLYAFGDNYWGQLGSATNNGTENPNPTPAQVPLSRPLPARFTVWR